MSPIEIIFTEHLIVGFEECFWLLSGETAVFQSYRQWCLPCQIYASQGSYSAEYFHRIKWLF